MASAAYLDYLQSIQWRYLAARVRARDGHACRDCGSRTSLHVHHLTYERIFHEPLDDLITVCDECHRARHGLAPIRRVPTPTSTLAKFMDQRGMGQVPQPRKGRRPRRRLRITVRIMYVIVVAYLMATFISAAFRTT